jgi:hypothetical protein
MNIIYKEWYGKIYKEWYEKNVNMDYYNMKVLLNFTQIKEMVSFSCVIFSPHYRKEHVFRRPAKFLAV